MYLIIKNIMSVFSEPTRAGSHRKTKMLTLDSGTFFYDKPDNTQCSFAVELDSPLILSNPAIVYLEGVYIGGFKFTTTTNPGDASSTANSKKVVTHFNIDIPEFDITAYAGTTGISSTCAFSGKFTIPNEKQVTTATPFVKAYLSRTAVYVSSIRAKTLHKIHVTITDQNGESIFDDGVAGDANPAVKSRRVTLQFIVAEENAA